uniref:Amiloride-sensitive sodium channel subunit alpha n=1 Tax=Steinernema glaseri TaxID=37863 RepID=A0A1I7ZIT0_9BILA
MCEGASQRYEAKEAVATRDEKMAPRNAIAPMGQQNPSVMTNAEMARALKEMENEQNTAKNEMRRQKLRKMKEIAMDWGAQTSCHGVAHIVDASSALTVFIWAFILICCLAGFVFLFTYSLREYLANEKLVGIEMSLKEIVFPSVTICNTNPYKLNTIKLTPELDALLIVYKQAQRGDSLS